MSQQVHGSPFEPLGSAEYAGAAAAISLTTVPTDAGGFGKTITQIETTLNSASLTASPRKIVHSLTFSIEGGSARVLTTGQTPTAAVGIAYAAGVYEWENDAIRIHGAQFFLPVGVTLNVEYGQ